MKLNYFLLALFILLVSCQKVDQTKVYKDFIDGYYHKGFNEFSHLLADSITLKDGDYEMKYSLSEYQEYYQWDSVFEPELELIDLKEVNHDLVVTTAITSKRYKFLGQHPLITQKKITFKKGKIIQIENLEYKNVDWNVWTSNRDSLVKWVDNNHPELVGFINKMNRQGAEEYLKAIDHFEHRSSAK